MDNRMIIGIDPGANGGICYTLDNEHITARKMMPVDEFARFLESVKQYEPIVFLEKVNLHTTDLSIKGKIFRLDKLIENYNGIRAALDIVGIPYCMVHPMKWQSALGLRIKGEAKSDRKKRYKEIASRLYGINATLWSADAILLMRFGINMMAQNPGWVFSNIPQKNHFLI